MSKRTVYAVAPSIRCCDPDVTAIYEQRSDAESAVKRLGGELVELDVYPAGDDSLRLWSHWEARGLINPHGVVQYWTSEEQRWMSDAEPVFTFETHIEEQFPGKRYHRWLVVVTAATQAEAEATLHDKFAEMSTAINNGQVPT